MVLQVAFEDFPDTVRRVLGEAVEAYIAHSNGVTLATATADGKATVVAATTSDPLDEAKTRLVEQKLRVFEGRWTDDVKLEHEGTDLEDIYIAGVSYKTEAGPPGIWIDAYPTLPTQVQVLKAMYEEMINTGESANVSFEEFVRLSDANVVVTSPSDIRSYLAQKVPA